MCGILGIISFKRKFNHEKDEKIFENMLETLVHRGPDDYGTWINNNRNVYFAHRRLSIIDLSVNAKQPMHSISKRFSIVFNGEIYNYKEIALKLIKAGFYDFNKDSDTSVLLAAIDKWGLNQTIPKLVGMFAFALWDNENERLSLVSDRLGKKPIYYGYINGDFIFGSELAPFKILNNFIKNNIDENGIKLLTIKGYIPAPNTIFKNIKKISSASILNFEKKDISNNSFPKESCYWFAKKIINNINNQNIFSSNFNLVDSLENKIFEAVKYRMISDVPVGSFLSGGIDSTLITLLMQNNSEIPIKTFSIGFEDKNYDETIDSSKISSILKTDHTSMILSKKNIIDVIPKISDIYSEPFADSSQIPTILVSQLASSHVKVCLTGDGGDELFGGYNRYLWAPKISKFNSQIPYVIRKILSSLILLLNPNKINLLFSFYNNFISKTEDYRLFGEKIHKVAHLLTSLNDEDIYQHLSNVNWSNKNIFDQINILEDNGLPILNNKPFDEKMMLWDLLDYLPNDILTKIDRATMSSSLEARSPFLDHNVVEFALKIPNRYKIKDNETKWILKEILRKYLPNEAINKPKMGFSIPLDNWLRSEIKDWAEELLSINNLKKHDIFNFNYIRKLWFLHKSRKFNFQHQLWPILIYLSWYDNNAF